MTGGTRRCWALCENGPQRHRVWRHAADLRSLSRDEAGARHEQWWNRWCTSICSHSVAYLFIITDHFLVCFWSVCCESVCAVLSCFASLGVCSTKRKHQYPEWTILSHVSCFIQGEVIGFQILLDSLHPHNTRASLWSPPVLQSGILLASVSSGISSVVARQGETPCLVLE